MPIKIFKITGQIIYDVLAKHFPTSYTKIIGGFSKRFRSFCAKLILEQCGSNINIEKGADFAANIKIGNNSGIGKDSIVGCFTEIGENVMMGEACFIYTRNHRFDQLDKPMCEQGFDEYKPVIISDDVWIGANATIMPGITVGDGAINATNSTVTKNVAPYSIVGGNPATEIKKRFAGEKINELLEMQWWNWDVEKITENLEYLTGRKK